MLISRETILRDATIISCFYNTTLLYLYNLIIQHILYFIHSESVLVLEITVLLLFFCLLLCICLKSFHLPFKNFFKYDLLLRVYLIPLNRYCSIIYLIQHFVFILFWQPLYCFIIIFINLLTLLAQILSLNYICSLLSYHNAGHMVVIQKMFK